MTRKEFRLIDFNSNIASNNKKKIGDNVILDLFNYQGSNERVITEDYLLFNCNCNSFDLIWDHTISFLKQFL